MGRTAREVYFAWGTLSDSLRTPFFYRLVLALCHVIGRHCEGGVRHYLSGHTPAMARARGHW